MTELREIIKNAAKKTFGIDIKPELTRPEEQFGDYSTNVALQLAAQLDKKPREIAEQLVAQFKSPLITKTEVAGPGFINFLLSDQALAELLDKKPAQNLTGQEIVVEYSDPNPFKVLHAGHLYTTIVGDVIAHLLESAGATVHRLNYGGDVGLHVGKTMWAIVKFLGGETPAKLAEVDKNQRLEWLSQRYVEGHEAYETDKQAQQEIIEYNKRVYKIHAENDKTSDLARLYWTGRQWSYEGFDQLYKELQITPFEKYITESEVTPLGVEMVQKGLADKVFEKSDGAIVFKGEEHGLHTRVFITSENLPTYEAKDLGLAAMKWQEYHFDLSVIITANDIADYMKVVYQALAHFYPEVVQRSKHFTHGVIKLPGGKKMSSRLGNILQAGDILLAAKKASLELSGQEQEEVTLAAVKYAFLKQRIGGDIIYDPEESVSLEGNSGPYLQYAHARARSILQKAKAKSVDIDKLEEGERSLARKVSEYPETIEKAVNELMPHHVATYLYELAQTFNRFYETNRVVGDPREAIRLKLVQSYANVLKNGLELLNIPAPERM